MNTRKAHRHHTYSLLTVSALAAALALTACGPQDGTATAATQAFAEAPAKVPVAVPSAQPARAVQPAPQRVVASATLGRVRAIEPINTRPQGSGAGAVVGGVLGAVLGNQIGKGDGRTAATAIGAVGGAVAGNNVERNYKSGVTGYRVRVEFDNGDSRTYEERQVNDLRVGDRVRADGGQLRRV